MDENIQNLIDKAPEFAVTYGLKLVLAIAVFFIGKAIVKWLANMLGAAMDKRNVDHTVASFCKHIAYYAMFTMVVIAALGQLGVKTASFVAILGAAGLAIGFALQGSLANFAAGVLLITFRPFKTGDYVEAGGASGSVQEISIFTTTLMTPDNKKIIIANGAVFGDNITNYSSQENRRVDLVVGVSYNADIAKTKEILLSVAQADERVLKDKDITIGLSELADSSVNFVLRPWVKTSDYWPTYFALMENIKIKLDEAGIEIPYPQMDVHLSKTED